MSYLLRSGARVLLALWVAVTAAFLLLRVLPGDAVQTTLLESGASAEVIAARQSRLGLDRAPLEQYAAFWLGLAQGDFGVSLLDGQPVLEKITSQAGATAELAFSAIITALAFGLILGTAEALSSHRAIRVAAHTLTNIALSAPTYWIGTLAIYLFSAQLGLLPSGGTNGSEALILPTLVLGFSGAGMIAEVTHGELMRAASQPHLAPARAKGLPEGMIRFRHVMRYAMPSIVTPAALQLGFLLGGTVITEGIFNRPGLGRLLVDSALRQDVPVVLGLVLVSAGIYCGLLMIAEIIRFGLDPRLRAV